MAKIHIFLILLSSLFLLLCPVSAYRGMVGARTEVKDVKTNEEVQELGRFCVKEFNMQQLLQHYDCTNGGKLMFSEVVAAQRQVVSGIKYYLKIEASNEGSGEKKVFDSIVVVKAWLQQKQLITFEPASNDIRRFRK